MEFFFEIIQFLLYIVSIIIISKYILVKTLRNLAKNLKLKPKTVGNITGISTSVPELLTICASSANGLTGASIYNVLSSNLINLIQYYIAIILNKNKEKLKNKAIKVEIFLVILTIILPIIIIIVGGDLKITMTPILILLYLGFIKIDNNVHQLYLAKEKNTKEVQEKRKRFGKKKYKKYS